MRPTLRRLSDVKVYVEASEEVRIERHINRAENSDEWIKRWVAAEDFYITKHDPKSAADVAFEGN